MPLCPHCCNEVAADAVFCPRCGKQKPATTESHLDEMMPVLLLLLFGCFVALLFAPAIEFISDNMKSLKNKAKGKTTQDLNEIKKAKEELLYIRIFLWVVLVVAWTVFVWIDYRNGHQLFPDYDISAPE